MEVSSKWAKMINELVRPEMKDVDRERFRFRGMHRGQAIFEYVLIHRDYDVGFFEEVRGYLEVYRKNVNLLCDMETAKISIKRKHGDFYYKCNPYHVWYYFVQYDEPVPRANPDGTAFQADLDRYWMLMHGKSFVMYGGTQLHISSIDLELKYFEIDCVAATTHLRRFGGIPEMVNGTYGTVLDFLRTIPVEIVNVEYRIREKGSNTVFHYAGRALEDLYLIAEYKEA